MKRALPLLLLTAPAAAQQYLTICSESFEYPAGSALGGLDGGVGWLNEWWSGQGQDGAVVVTPGYDALGHKLVSNISAEGSYRKPDPAPHPDVAEGGLFGADGATLWISFTSRQDPNSIDEYGGFSLFEQWVGEQLFLGSPYNEDRWGVDQLGSIATDPNSDDTVLTRLVYRIEFLPGQETVSMWLDPADPHPLSTTPNLVHVVEDFRFDEVRFEAGNDGDPTGFFWDELLIEKQVPAGPIGDSYCGPANLNSTGQAAEISAWGDLDVSQNLCEVTGEKLPANQFGYFLTSDVQAFVSSPPGSQGNLCLGGQIGRFSSQIQNSGAAGEMSIDVDLTDLPVDPPHAVQPGETWNFQLWFS